VDGQVLEFGVSGVLRFSNLVMYDRQTESWWQEFLGEAIVGDMTGKNLERLPMSVVSWKEFKAAHSEGKVLSRPGQSRPYGRNPYTFYDSSSPFLYEGPKDERLPAIERVAGIEIGKESVAVPYPVLEKAPVAHFTLGGRDLVVFFKKGTASALDRRSIAEGRDVGAVGVFDPNLDGRTLTFKTDGGNIVDEQTGSTWNLLGEAQSGPLAGKTLSPITYLNSFWFAWVAFKPDTVIYRGQSEFTPK